MSSERHGERKMHVGPRCFLPKVPVYINPIQRSILGENLYILPVII